jgi:formate hydrogenlyase subunit 3/multisubunit Na+/H+ antiporter MnhD subunit
MMHTNPLFLPFLIPLSASLVVLLVSRARYLKEGVVLLSTLANLLVCVFLFNKNMHFSAPWFGGGFDFSLRLYSFSAFIILAVSFFTFLIGLFSLSFLSDKRYAGSFYFYFLLCAGFAQAAVLANNLLVMLFFWEGLLLSLFGMIAIGNQSAFKTATKAFVIVGISDLCMMVGIALTGFLAGTFTISKIHLSAHGLAAVAFLLLFVGAISKAGSMPFHTWIPDAAIDAPLPFMAFVPGAPEKLIRLYFLTRISLDMFALDPHSSLSIMMMVVGAVTILAAVMMALIQKDYKRLLSYHAISQVGYMILGIGTALPVGIIGGLFHMLNNALYKSCLFLTAGAVEKQAGTTNLAKLGGLRFRMPVTFAVFAVCACSISGVPPFNGFFSKELVYDGALERGLVFYLAASIGSFFTAASFLKLGHAAFIGRKNQQNDELKEAPVSMLIPMIIIACLCVGFGIFNTAAIKTFFLPVLGAHAGEHHFGGMPQNITLVIVTLLVLAAALLNHWWGVKRTGSGLKAVDHIHYAPLLHQVYEKADARLFDPYELGMKLVSGVSRVCFWCDRFIDWVYDGLAVNVTLFFTEQIKRRHSGEYSTYIGWSLLGALVVVVFLLSR